VLSSDDIARIQARAHAAATNPPQELPIHIPEPREPLGVSVQEAVHEALRRGGLTLPDAPDGQDALP
jgi:hypothetical protein